MFRCYQFSGMDGLPGYRTAVPSVRRWLIREHLWNRKSNRLMLDALLHHSRHDPHNRAWALSDVILGGQDGLVNVLGVILGVAAATSDPHLVLVAGLSATFAESVSMGAVAYTSTLADADFYESEREREYRHIQHTPELERDEIRSIYKEKGFHGGAARADCGHDHRQQRGVGGGDDGGGAPALTGGPGAGVEGSDCGGHLGYCGLIDPLAALLIPAGRAQYVGLSGDHCCGSVPGGGVQGAHDGRSPDEKRGGDGGDRHARARWWATP